MTLWKNPDAGDESSGLEMAKPPEYSEDRATKEHYLDAMEFSNHVKEILAKHPGVISEVTDLHERIRTSEIDDGTPVELISGRRDAHLEALRSAKVGAQETLIDIEIEGSDKDEINRIMAEIQGIQKGASYTDRWGDEGPRDRREYEYYTSEPGDSNFFVADFVYKFGDYKEEVSKE